jgi:hypothetical protein
MIAELIPLILLNFRDDDSGSDDYSKPVRSKSTISRRESDRSDGEEEMRGSKSKSYNTYLYSLPSSSQ